MLYQVVIAALLIIFTINLVLNLRTIIKPDGRNKIPYPVPRVSVLIPARNEERNIRACLESLQMQDYPDYEVLVLDDSSTDSTSIIVSEIAAMDSRISLIQGKKLPPGWAGKTYACQQLARQASGSWLLFTDADTVHRSNMLSSVLAVALEYKPSLISGFPRQITSSITQKIAIPVFNFILVCWLPFWWLQRDSKSRPSFANGQFLLFSKDEYWKMGGHASVKSRILEDVWLGAEVYRSGGRVLAVDLSGVVACHMYRSFNEMWHGFAKCIYAFASMPLLMIPLAAFAGFLFLGPFYNLYNQFVFKDTLSSWWYLVVLQVGAIIFMRLLVNHHFKESLYSTVFHPLGLGFFLLNAVYVLTRRILGYGISWKQRLYTPESGIE